MSLKRLRLAFATIAILAGAVLVALVAESHISWSKRLRAYSVHLRVEIERGMQDLAPGGSRDIALPEVKEAESMLYVHAYASPKHIRKAIPSAPPSLSQEISDIVSDQDGYWIFAVSQDSILGSIEVQFGRNEPIVEGPVLLSGPHLKTLRIRKETGPEGHVAGISLHHIAK
ncbi:hypothetical protein JYT83_00020 [bacterium AH-315-F18]|nr:hypothetical protein [bacterium AH-315-F18]